MFTKLFGKSSFALYTFFSVFLLFGVVFNYYTVNYPEGITYFERVELYLFFLFLLISLILVKRFISKETRKINGKYYLFIFPSLLFCIPPMEWDIWLWISTFFIWAALMETLTASKYENNTEKIFNAGFWTVVAYAFYPPSIFYLFFVWIGFFLITRNKIKIILVSLLPLACLFFIEYAIQTIIPSFLLFPKLNEVGQVNFSSFEEFLSSYYWKEKLFIFILIVICFLERVVKKIMYNREETLFIQTILFGLLMLFIGQDSGVAYILIIMTVTTGIEKSFERIYRKWLKALFFIAFIASVLFLKGF